MRTILMSLFGLLVMLSTSVQASEDWMYIPSILDGPPGTPGFEGDFEVDFLSLDTALHELTFIKRLDSVTPTLLSALISGKNIPVVELLHYNVAGTQAQPDLVTLLSDALVVDRFFIPDPLQERLTLRFATSAVVSAVPEPSAASMTLMGLLSAGVLAHLRKRRAVHS